MRIITQYLVLLLVPAMFSGCVARTTVKESRTLNVDHVGGTALNVESDNGSIRVLKSDRDDVQIVAGLKALSAERLEETRVIAERDGTDQLLVRVEWPDKRHGSEGCDFDIHIPNAMGITLKSSNGRLEVANLEGAADLVTSNGAVTINGLVGDAKVKTSNGGVTVKDVSGSINADTSNGPIEIHDARADVIADTSNGKITMSLADDATGPFHLESSNAKISIELNAAFAGLLSCGTSNGGIDLDGVRGRVVSDGKTNRMIQFGDSTTMSEIKTTNGSVIVMQRSPSPQ